MKIRSIAAAAVATAAVAATLAGCAAPSGSPSPSTSTVGAASATSAAAIGGIDALYAAAKAEGQLNVIALPHDWTNYGKIIDGFKAKYPGITVNEANPGGSSQEEIDAITGAADPATAPDVVDVGQAVAYANPTVFAPYQVATWADIPDSLKESTGLFYNDYAGHMVIGYDSSKTQITSLDDLLKPGVKFGLSGDPTGSNEALNAVLFASLIKGGAVDDVQAGIDFFGQAAKAGTFYKNEVNQNVLAAGDANAVIGWDYNQVAITAANPNWKLYVDPAVALAGPYFQAVSKTAPHPAAARLWEEYLYSDEGQNFYYTGGGYPARGQAMQTAGTLSSSAPVPSVPSTATLAVPTPDDLKTDAATMTSGWAAAIG